jgi:tRNA(fMet)-specific endonuclease VapC
MHLVEKVKAFEPFELKLSAVSVAELEYGMAKSKYSQKNKATLVEFLSSFDILPFDDNDAEYFGEIKALLERQGNIIGPYDLQIAAQALSRKMILGTNNVKEFMRVPNLRIENWV